LTESMVLPLQKEEIVGKKKKKATKKEEVKKVNKNLLKVKSIRPLYNHCNAKDLPLRIDCGWIGMISKNTYKAFGGGKDNAPFIILDKIK